MHPQRLREREFAGGVTTDASWRRRTNRGWVGVPSGYYRQIFTRIVAAQNQNR